MRPAVVGWEGGRVVSVVCREWQRLDWVWCGLLFGAIHNPNPGRTSARLAKQLVHV